ncbi:Hypothetical_protein [Hexamita inflata]|uniref:Hypothetical_protein n=1 Tax=Hexamita inflata TaxID=28002 RepID=A0AA86UVD8_9EUKA|nr:Hypothetical protein HINF_LOCUS60960 [Hexamita inflata]
MNPELQSFVTSPFTFEFAQAYTQNISDEIAPTESISMDTYPVAECAWSLLPQTALYYQFKAPHERQKFLFNIQKVIQFYVNLIRASEDIYLQRVFRFQAIRSSEKRNALVQFGFKAFDEAFKVMKFEKHEAQVKTIVRAGLHLALLKEEMGDQGDNGDVLKILVQKMSV